MSLFQELVFDALCGHRGRFIPGMTLEKLRQERRILGPAAQVPVPRSEPKSPNVHVAQVATELDFRASKVTWVPYDKRWDDLRGSPATANVET